MMSTNLKSQFKANSFLYCDFRLVDIISNHSFHQRLNRLALLKAVRVGTYKWTGENPPGWERLKWNCENPDGSVDAHTQEYWRPFENRDNCRWQSAESSSPEPMVVRISQNYGVVVQSRPNAYVFLNPMGNGVS